MKDKPELLMDQDIQEYFRAIEDTLVHLTIILGIALEDLVMIKGTPNKRIADKALRHFTLKANDLIIDECWICFKHDLKGE